MRFLFFPLFIFFIPSINASVESDVFFESLEAHQFFSASFEQKTIYEGKERVIQGEIIADRSGKFKIKYFHPLYETIFSDGQYLYRYDPDLEQASVQPLDELLRETPIGLFTLNVNEIKELFSVSNCSKKLSKLKCSLTSMNEESFIKQIVIRLNKGIIFYLGYEDTFNQNISITFKHASLNKIPADKFKFIIPEGTDIVNLKNNIE